jgi:hypothetical protein
MRDNRIDRTIQQSCDKPFPWETNIATLSKSGVFRGKIGLSYRFQSSLKGADHFNENQ